MAFIHYTRLIVEHVIADVHKLTVNYYTYRYLNILYYKLSLYTEYKEQVYTNTLNIRIRSY